jgi:hypothetical protein
MSDTYRQSENINAIPLPPFGRSLDESTPCIRIHMANQESWKRCYRENLAGYKDLLLLPADKEPSELRWPVSGKDALVLDGSGEAGARLRSLCETLMEYGARNIIVFRENGQQSVFIQCDEQ